jgi:hypothetical protein
MVRESMPEVTPVRHVTFPWGRVVLARSRLPIVAVFLWALAAPVSTSAVTLNPPPPDFETCHGQGSHTICHGRQVFPVGGDPTGIFCGSGSDAFEIIDHPGLLIQEATRWYDADGNLVARKIHEVWLRSEWMNPVTGATVAYRQEATYSDEFAVPGDLGSAVETTTGVVNFVVPGHGAIVRNAGRTVFSFDGTLEFRAGPQAFVDYFVDGDLAALEPICDALAT